MTDAAFEEYITKRILNCGSLNCFDNDEEAKEIITTFILPFTEWDSSIIEKADTRNIMFWYLMRLFYLYADTDTPIGRLTDEIYCFFDNLYI